MKLRAILIDDEKHNLDNLQVLLNEYCPQVQICGSAGNAAEAKNLIAELQPDLVFLDIQMPGETGFDVLRSIPERHFEVIFVTAYDQFAIQAMRFAAIDYLLKPVAVDELTVAVERAQKQYVLKQGNSRLDNLMSLLQNQHDRDAYRISLATFKEIRFVKPKDIMRCHSSNNYTQFFLLGGEELLVSKPIYEYEELLQDFGFIRCHQSHLVNKQFIKSWKKEYGDFLLMNDGAEIPISKGKKEHVRAILY